MPQNLGRTARLVGQLSVLLMLSIAPVGLLAADGPPPPGSPNYVSTLYELQLEPTRWKKLFEIPEFRICGSLRMDSDGESVLFDGYKAQQGATMVDTRLLHYRLDGSLREDLGQGTMPTRSPDGRRLCFSAYHDRGVWIMDSNGKNARKIDPEGWGIQWSTVSPSEVAYTRRRGLVIHDVDTGKVRDVFPGGASPYQLVHYNFAWSPDGRRIAFLGETAGAGRELAVVEAQGAEFGYKVHLRTRPSAALTWFADGDRLAFPIKTEAGWYEIHQLDLRGDATASTLIPGQPTDRNRISVCAHPDGKRLFVLSYEMKHPVTGETFVPPPLKTP